MERERLANLLRAHGHDDRVPGVVPSSASRAYIEVGGKDVDELAFAFIAPLRAEHDRRCARPASSASVPSAHKTGDSPVMVACKPRHAAVLGRGD